MDFVNVTVNDYHLEIITGIFSSVECVETRKWKEHQFLTCQLDGRISTYWQSQSKYYIPIQTTKLSDFINENNQECYTIL